MKTILLLITLASGLAYGDNIDDYRNYLNNDIRRRQIELDQAAQPRCRYVYITDQNGNVQSVYVCD